MSNENLTDEEYFRLMMQSVKPLRLNEIKHQLPNPKKDLGDQKRKIPAPQTNYEIYSYTNYNNPVTSEDLIVYYKNSLSDNQRKKLQQGQLTVQAKLDLHGLNVDESRQQICDFIQQQSNLKHRCLLIIHGKGGLHNETPVLKNHVNNWLKQFPQVLAFHSAHKRHGGAGAVYVLLKNLF
jgi:DNA-nicking Smr family endonuclease